MRLSRANVEGYDELNVKLVDLDLLEELMAEEAAEKGENPDIVRSIPICTIKVPENNENGGGE